MVKNQSARIVTFNKLKTKAVLKDVGRVLNYPFDTINDITKHVPSIFGKVKSLEDCYNEIKEFKEYFDEVPDRKKLLNYSVVLENLNKNVSVHASGIVIAPSDITDFVPVCKTPQVENQYMTQYDMKMLEDAGLIKMDFLGLKELKILGKTIDLVEKRYNKRINPDTLDLDDEKTYELISSGQTIGIFQFANSRTRDYLTKLKPKDINDLSAMNALNRPGPMDLIPDFIERKCGRKEITYPHPKIEPILKETYGIIVYQEQVMQIVREVAGHSLAKADIVRRAMGKKDQKLLKEQEKEFISGASKNGYDKKIAKEIFKLILKFADYGFNKSHSVAYSIVAYYTAYFKTHYPIEFMTSLLNCRKDDTDEMVLLINECKRMKIQLSKPDINISFSDFTIDDKNENTILFGLSSIKNVGPSVVEILIKEREEHGSFKNFIEFCSRVDTRVANKKTIESLIYAGAFDSIEPNRRKLFENYEIIINKYGNKKLVTGQSSLFGGDKIGAFGPYEFMYNKPDWSDREKLSYEKSVLGIYLSSHPLADYEYEVNKLSTFKFGDIEQSEEGIDVSKISTVRMCGIISNVKLKQSKKGNRFATFTLEDFTGQGECVVFPQTYEDNKNIIQNENIVMITGRAQENGTEIKLIINEIKPLVKFEKAGQGKDSGEEKKVIIKIYSSNFSSDGIMKLKSIFNGKKGNCYVYFDILGKGQNHSLMKLENLSILRDSETENLLYDIFGKNNIIFK